MGSVTVGVDKELYIECDAPFAKGDIGAHAEPVELFLADGYAAHTAAEGRSGTLCLGGGWDDGK
jgi:hypothetical protein